ncbi:MAG: HAMP domain-containing histidine kinase [Dehalococcoidia bacterium]|nr:HAMP domain-containing histidine kinase [Dehalococcoidia bacterium]
MKKAAVVFIVILALGLSGILLIFENDARPAPDMVAINDAVMQAVDSGNQADALSLLGQQLLREYESMDAARQNRDRGVLVGVCIYTGILAVASVGLYLYCERSILAPFRKLRRFARDVATGNLDIPLEMDPHGSFGAFTESFDLMREELKKARENERAADRSKKELVASLNHDIKTPVASIKAATELMLVSARDEKEKSQLARIEAKAEQINALITDMFHATLEDLQALSVSPIEVPSTAIPGLIQSADYKGLVKPFSIPECIVMADPVRLQQVLDNIIGNSYKYAGTDIEVRAAFDGAFLLIDIADYGYGAPEDELPLLLNKFYRGKNAAEKSGYGLGLYIAKYLLTHMSGDLCCENRARGFVARLTLRLAG